MKNKIKLFACDIDGTLTDGTVFVGKYGEFLKQFSHRDGRGFHRIKTETKSKAMLITSEVGGINKARGDKFLKLNNIQFYSDGEQGIGKLRKVKEVCKELNITLNEVAFIGDDTNDFEVLNAVGFKGCPNDAVEEVKQIDNIYVSKNKAGKGAVREYIDYLLKENCFED
jgi:N-acylneuraminate cytidylyltransferase